MEPTDPTSTRARFYICPDDKDNCNILGTLLMELANIAQRDSMMPLLENKCKYSREDYVEKDGNP